MKDAAVDFGAISETTVFLDFFKNLPDPRQPGKVVYPLDEILLLCFAGSARRGRDVRRHCPVR